MNDRRSTSSANTPSIAQSRHGHPGITVHHQNSSASSPQMIHAVLHQPSTPGEWQLLMVLQRANLVQYYDTFISQGGDDVQQLLESGEEEFLEIMALVGMASKPLHVRRLQKALQEYSINPAAFQLLAIQKAGTLPMNATTAMLTGAPHPQYPSVAASLLATNPMMALNIGFGPSSTHSTPNNCHRSISAQPPTTAQHHANNSNANAMGHGTPPNSSVNSTTTNATAAISIASSESPGATSLQSNGSSNIWPSPRADAYDLGINDHVFGNHGTAFTLTEAHIQRLAECAAELLRQIPDTEPKTPQPKKKISRELTAVMELPVNFPFRVDEFRRYAAIYGRFDAKRKSDKLTFHELLVNEAAAQICLLRPALLTRRDELFPLARLIVKDVDFTCLKSSSRPKSALDEVTLDNGALSMTIKRPPPSECTSGNSDETDNSGESPAPSTSSNSQSSPGSGVLTISLSPPTAASGDHRSECTTSSALINGRRPKRRLDDIGMELQRVNAEQEACKRRVNEAQEMGDVIAVQKELNRLTQRQMELSNEQAVLKDNAVGFNHGQMMHSKANNESGSSDVDQSISGAGSTPMACVNESKAKFRS